MSDMGTPKIYCFINSSAPEWYVVIALAEDGDCLAQHVSSSPGWAKSDIGIDSKCKHDLYTIKYPDGYELEWIESKDIEAHVGLMKAYELNQAPKKPTETTNT